MTLSEEQVQSFIECWEKDFGEVLAPEEARSEATRVVEFLEQFAEGLTRIRRRKQERAGEP